MVVMALLFKVNGLILSELCSCPILAFCMGRHIVGGIVFYKNHF